MSSERSVPLNNADENPYVAPGADPLVSTVTASTTDRLLEREYRDSRPLGEMPFEPAPKLHGTAQTMGSAMGKAVNKARELPRRVAEMKERFTVIRGRKREEAASTAHELRENAKQKFEQAQSRAQYYAHEYPVQFILGVGAAGLVIGFLLRVWRSSRRG